MAKAKSYWSKWYKKNRERFKAVVNEHKKARRKQFQEIIDGYKQSPCVVCGEVFHPAAMEFIHKDDNDKAFRISDATRLIYSVDKLVKEIEKCFLQCACCSRIVQFEKYLKDKNKNKRKNRRRIKLRFLVDGIKSQPCADCGRVLPPYCLDLDHLGNEEKVDSVSKMLNNELSLDRIMKEVDKTEPVCINCHRARTQNRKKD